MTYTQAALYLVAMLVTATVTSQIFNNLAAFTLLVGALLTVAWFWKFLGSSKH